MLNLSAGVHWFIGERRMDYGEGWYRYWVGVSLGNIVPLDWTISYKEWMDACRDL